MRFQDLTSNKRVTQAGLFVGQHTPRWLGYGLAWIAAGIIACRKPEIYRTVRANLRQVVGPSVDDGALHRMARQVFIHAGQTYYDFFHAISQPPEVIARAVRIPGSVIEQIKSTMASGQGVLLLGVHTSNFDLGMLTLCARGLPIHALSLADPPPGFRFLNRLRAMGGLEIAPITPQSLRAAIRHLKNGGLVLTGIDRPIPDDREDRELIEFFGRPAYLPLGPARLARMTGAAVLVGSCHYSTDDGYVLEFSGAIEMVHTGDRRQDTLTNTRRLAAITEEYVRAHPEQWMMFYPPWPGSPAR